MLKLSSNEQQHQQTIANLSFDNMTLKMSFVSKVLPVCFISERSPERVFLLFSEYPPFGCKFPERTQAFAFRRSLQLNKKNSVKDGKTHPAKVENKHDRLVTFFQLLQVLLVRVPLVSVPPKTPSV